MRHQRRQHATLQRHACAPASLSIFPIPSHSCPPPHAAPSPPLPAHLPHSSTSPPPQVRGSHSRASTIAKIQKEAQLHQRLSEVPRVAQLLDLYEDAESVHMVCELCPGGDLKQHVETYGTLDEHTLAQIAFEVLSTVKAFHARGILYGECCVTSTLCWCLRCRAKSRKFLPSRSTHGPPSQLLLLDVRS
jgi:hypothetical protein